MTVDRYGMGGHQRRRRPLELQRGQRWLRQPLLGRRWGGTQGLPVLRKLSIPVHPPPWGTVPHPGGIMTDTQTQTAPPIPDDILAAMRAYDPDNHGVSWLRSAKKVVSPECERIAVLVDWLFHGIYHAEKAVLRADWSSNYVALLVSTDLATFDAPHLTRLVIAAHDLGVRVQVSAEKRHLRIMLHPRDTREGSTYVRHPTLEQAIGMWRPHAMKHVVLGTACVEGESSP